ncbi:hypothetical protein [Micromonospora sp. NPDC049497]
MSARRLGRLLGSLLALAALVALPFVEPPTDYHLTDFEWGSSVASQVSVR